MGADLTHAQANDLLRRAGLMRDEIRETPSAVRIAIARRLRAFERVVESARVVREDLEHQCCEQGDDVECVCEPGLDPCPRCRMFALLDRALAELDGEGNA